MLSVRRNVRHDGDPIREPVWRRFALWNFDCNDSRRACLAREIRTRATCKADCLSEQILFNSSHVVPVSLPPSPSLSIVDPKNIGNEKHRASSECVRARANKSLFIRDRKPTERKIRKGARVRAHGRKGFRAGLVHKRTLSLRLGPPPPFPSVTRRSGKDR